VIYASGASKSRDLGVPGERLPGHHAAADFIGWYNLHPDHGGDEFDLSSERAVISGNGNVALNVARILLMSTEELAMTDIAEHALEVLSQSNVREGVKPIRSAPTTGFQRSPGFHRRQQSCWPSRSDTPTSRRENSRRHQENGNRMATHFSQSMDRKVDGAGQTMRARLHVAGHTIKYRLDVVAASVVDAVEFAGGLLFDRAMAGWDVTVIVADQSDRLPLQILGAEVIDLEEVLTSEASGPDPQTVAVAADVLARDSRVRRGVLRALHHRGIEVVMWGEPGDARLDNRRFALMEHRLSVAARAFKSRALIAAANPAASIELYERFHTRAAIGTSARADLIPAS
jgi:hypothetical protein